jgi:hypothetical protein
VLRSCFAEWKIRDTGDTDFLLRYRIISFAMLLALLLASFIMYNPSDSPLKSISLVFSVGLMNNLILLFH